MVNVGRAAWVCQWFEGGQVTVHVRSSVYLGNKGSSANSFRMTACICRFRSCLRSHHDPTTTSITYTTYNPTRAPASQRDILPSQSVNSTRPTATVKKPTSRRNGPRCTWKGLMIHIEPTTQDTINVAAPRSSPTAKLPDCARIAENVENTSGLPFPNARKVTPATFSSRPSN